MILHFNANDDDLIQDKDMDDASHIVAAVLRRLRAALAARAYKDAVVLLRQLVRFKGVLFIDSVMYGHLEPLLSKSHLIVSKETEMDLWRIEAADWQPSWLKHAEQIDMVIKRRPHSYHIADGMLYAFSANKHWHDYLSEAQKAALDMWLFAPHGTTTLASLPTGSGKSMLTMLPAWLDSQNKGSKGATLVVVPTVALALDQHRQAKAFFQAHNMPMCQTGMTNQREREEIMKRLKDGSLPILFTSPESLLLSRLYETCLEAAKNGLIQRIVIDEAHLVESWGADFRPEFQLLAAYRRQLLKASKGNLKTLLLSATITDSSHQILKKLFSERGKLLTVEANRLRPEIGFWFSQAPTEHERLERISEALRHVARPLIIYTTQPNKAKKLYSDLRAEGYQRIACFTGDTKDSERTRLNRAWQDNEIDIMVATSAFGLGVDKADVRTIIHATIPENIDRFYQEVGRAGRDGWSAASLLCSAPADRDIAMDLTPKRLTSEKAYPRWRAMMQTRRPSERDRQCFQLNCDTQPPKLRNKRQSENNREWNYKLILMLQRANLLEIVDVPPPTFIPINNDEELVEAWVEVRLLDERLWEEDEQIFSELIKRQRDVERQVGVESLEQLQNLITSYTRHAERTDCIARTFSKQYSNTQKACGGCPSCRAHNREPYVDAHLKFEVRYTIKQAAAYENPISKDNLVDNHLREKLGSYGAINVIWSGRRDLVTLQPLLKLLPVLLRKGFQQFVLPRQFFEDIHVTVLRDLLPEFAKPQAGSPLRPHRLIPDTWVTEYSIPFVGLPTVLLYSPEDETADALFRAFKQQRQHIHIPCVLHILHEQTYLVSEGKAFTEHVSGLTYPTPHFEKMLEETEITLDLF